LSTVSIQTNTAAYSFTTQTISTYYYRVTLGGGASAGTAVAVQYVIPTKGAPGTSTSTFTPSGLATVGPTSITFTGNNATATSDQTYPTTQALYLQARLPGQPTVTGTTTYNMVLYDPTTGTGTAATVCLYVTVATASGSTTYTVLYRDGATAQTLVAATTPASNPSQFSFYWDGVSNMFVYLGGSQIAIYKFTTTWASARAQFDTTAYGATASPVSITDVRLYPTGSIATAQNWRLKIQNVANTTLTNLTSPAISTSTYGTYYYITNSGFTGLTLPATLPAAGDAGAFWVLRNNTSSYLSVSVTNPSNLSSPLVIPPSNAVTIVWNGTNYTLF